MFDKKSVSIEANAPAKINLSVVVKDKRDDGYHNVYLVMQAINVLERVKLTLSRGKDIRIQNVRAKDGKEIAFIPTDERNIVFKTAKAYFDYVGTDIADIGLFIKVYKSVPVGAGLGGGSSDSAAALVALNHLFSGGLNMDELCEIGSTIGADVPFCLVGGSAVATGKGTALTRINNLPDCHIVIAKPKISISTGKAYQLINSHRDSLRNPDPKILESAIEKGDLKEIAKNMVNHFETVLAFKVLDDIREIMKKHGSFGAQMSGSGSAVFGIFDNKEKAESCRDEIVKSLSLECFICNPYHEGAKVLIN